MILFSCQFAPPSNSQASTLASSHNMFLVCKRRFAILLIFNRNVEHIWVCLSFTANRRGPLAVNPLFLGSSAPYGRHKHHNHATKRPSQRKQFLLVSNER